MATLNNQKMMKTMMLSLLLKKKSSSPAKHKVKMMMSKWTKSKNQNPQSKKNFPVKSIFHFMTTLVISKNRIKGKLNWKRMMRHLKSINKRMIFHQKRNLKKLMNKKIRKS